VLTSGEAIEDLLKPRLTLPKASDVAATRARGVGDCAIADGPVDGGDAGSRNVGIGRRVNGSGLLLVDLVRGLCDDSVVGRRVVDVGGGLIRSTLMTRRDNGAGRCRSWSISPDESIWGSGG
jgi:hypothetical protein